MTYTRRRRRVASLAALAALVLSALVPMAALAADDDGVIDVPGLSNPGDDGAFPFRNEANQPGEWRAWAEGYFDREGTWECRANDFGDDGFFTVADSDEVALLVINAGAATDPETRSSVWVDPEPGVYSGVNQNGRRANSNVITCTFAPSDPEPEPVVSLRHTYMTECPELSRDADPSVARIRVQARAEHTATEPVPFELRWNRPEPAGGWPTGAFLDTPVFIEIPWDDVSVTLWVDGRQVGGTATVGAVKSSEECTQPEPPTLVQPIKVWTVDGALPDEGGTLLPEDGEAFVSLFVDGADDPFATWGFSSPLGAPLPPGDGDLAIGPVPVPAGAELRWAETFRAPTGYQCTSEQLTFDAFVERFGLLAGPGLPSEAELLRPAVLDVRAPQLIDLPTVRPAAPTVVVVNDCSEEEIEILPEVIAPTAALGAACVEGTEDALVTVTLDNQASTVAFGFEVVFGDEPAEPYELDAGTERVLTRTVAQGEELEVRVAYGDTVLSETFDADACAAERITVTPEPDPEPETEPETIPVEIEVAGTQLELPQTGASTLLLAALGLLSLGLGGGLVRSRRDHG